MALCLTTCQGRPANEAHIATASDDTASDPVDTDVSDRDDLLSPRLGGFVVFIGQHIATVNMTDQSEDMHAGELQVCRRASISQVACVSVTSIYSILGTSLDPVNFAGPAAVRHAPSVHYTARERRHSSSVPATCCRAGREAQKNRRCTCKRIVVNPVNTNSEQGAQSGQTLQALRPQSISDKLVHQCLHPRLFALQTLVDQCRGSQFSDLALACCRQAALALRSLHSN